MPVLRRWEGDLTHPPVLVGEDNPYGGRPGNALFPGPNGSAGHRLCVKIFGMDPRQYLLAFLRYNLCTGKWNAEEAQRRAAGLVGLYYQNPLILLGAKVSKAFGFPTFKPFEIDRNMLMLPHPSGRCREWNKAGAYERARDALERIISQ